jgi:hypothetical protein
VAVQISQPLAHAVHDMLLKLGYVWGGHVLIHILDFIKLVLFDIIKLSKYPVWHEAHLADALEQRHPSSQTTLTVTLAVMLVLMPMEELFVVVLRASILWAAPCLAPKIFLMVALSEITFSYSKEGSTSCHSAPYKSVELVEFVELVALDNKS